MDLTLYQQLTGTTVPASRVTYVTAKIERTRRDLEELLGYTLDLTHVMDNEYIVYGEEPVFAYRLFSYNKNDKYLSIDPCFEVYSVKLVRNGVTIKTFDADEFRIDQKRGLIRYLEVLDDIFPTITDLRDEEIEEVQLAVDARWFGPSDTYEWENELPDDLLYVWADMIDYETDDKSDIKSETLGTHSYTKFSESEAPEANDKNLSVLRKYAGPNGSLYRQVTI